MSAIRDTARRILEAALPANTVITSNGATASKYEEMTGLSHKTLTDNWAKGGIMTGCNGFTGWYGRKLGSTAYLGGFDLKGIVAKAGKPEAWVPSTSSNMPDYGDILRHTSFHVDVCLDFEGELLVRAAGGQGGKSAGCDIIKRVRGSTPYDPAKLMGWIDIDIYFDQAPPEPQPTADDGLRWLYGWWTVWDGSYYYYHFGPQGRVQYIETKPAPGAGPSSRPENRGNYTYEEPGELVITWNPTGDGVTQETFRNAFPNVTKMNATSNRYSPLVATKIH